VATKYIATTYKRDSVSDRISQFFSEFVNRILSVTEFHRFFSDFVKTQNLLVGAFVGEAVGVSVGEFVGE
jgi:hypothetical protein